MIMNILIYHFCVVAVLQKIQRFKKGKNRNQPKFPGDQGKYFVFKTHSENLLRKGTCSICSYSQRQSPRKRLGAVLVESSTVSQGKKAKNSYLNLQLLRSRAFNNAHRFGRAKKGMDLAI